MEPTTPQTTNKQKVVPPNFDKPKKANEDEEPFWEEIFITAHADGGPDEAPTPRDGMYGMYYVQGKLRMAHNDPLTQPLTVAINHMLEQGLQKQKTGKGVSVHDGLVQQLQEHLRVPQSVATELYNLAVAGYGNTATVTDLTQLSLSILASFEQYWEEHEEHGDFRLPKHLGMYSVVQALQTYLETNFGGYNGGGNGQESTRSSQEEDYDNGACQFQLLVNSPVERVVEQESNAIDDDVEQEENSSSGAGKKILVTYSQRTSPPSGSQGDETVDSYVIEADQVVVAVPPPLLPRILPDLPKEKRTALNYVSFNNICKVVLKFSKCFWPPKLQSIVSAEGYFPELWFRPNFGGFEDDTSEQSHLVVFYLSDDYADNFVEECLFENMADDSNFTWDKNKASELCLEHLAKVLEYENEDPTELRKLLVNVLIHDWKSHPYVEGGHFAPKVGMTPAHLQALAAPMGQHNKIHFCGEATNTNACGTVQAAMETGVRAANAVIEQQQQREQNEVLQQQEAQEQQGEVALQNTKDPQVDGGDDDEITVNNEDVIDPDKVSDLVQRQISISRTLAKQEESSFTLIQSLEQRQMEASRALLEQEVTSFHMIQTVEQMAAKVHEYHTQLTEAVEAQAQLDKELQSTMLNKKQSLEENEQQLANFKYLQGQWDALQQTVQEKDDMLREKDEQIDTMSQKVEILSRQADSKGKAKKEFEIKNQLIQDIDSIIQVMDQKVKTIQGQIDEAKSETEIANAKVKERDEKIESMSREMQALRSRVQTMESEASSSVTSSTGTAKSRGRKDNSGMMSPSERMKQVKAAREEKLQNIMRRMRIGGGGSRRDKAGSNGNMRENAGEAVAEPQPRSANRIDDAVDDEYHRGKWEGTACIKQAFLGGRMSRGRANQSRGRANNSRGRTSRSRANQSRGRTNKIPEPRYTTVQHPSTTNERKHAAVSSEPSPAPTSNSSVA